MNKLLSAIEKYEEEVIKWEMEVEKIKASDDYKVLEKQLEDMTPEKPDSTEADKARDKIMDKISAGDIPEGVSPKYKESKAVNSSKFLEVIGGDIDVFTSLATITQKSLKDFAKTQPDLKKVIEGCIETTGRVVSGFKIIKPEVKKEIPTATVTASDFDA